MDCKNVLISITAEAEEKLRRIHLTAERARDVVKNAEITGEFICVDSTNVRYAHMEVGTITLWVKYQRLNNVECRIESAYMHRIKILGAV